MSVFSQHSITETCTFLIKVALLQIQSHTQLVGRLLYESLLEVPPGKQRSPLHYRNTAVIAHKGVPTPLQNIKTIHTLSEYKNVNVKIT